MSISYQTSLEGISFEHLQGFFVGWPNPPTAKTLLRILEGSGFVVLAIESGRVVGFINALSDGVLSAFIPLLEVLPEFQRRGIGSELVRRMMQQLEGRYAIDIVCDEDVAPFYQKLGLQRGLAMMKRDYQVQSGRELS